MNGTPAIWQQRLRAVRAGPMADPCAEPTGEDRDRAAIRQPTVALRRWATTVISPNQSRRGPMRSSGSAFHIAFSDRGDDRKRVRDRLAVDVRRRDGLAGRERCHGHQTGALQAADSPASEKYVRCSSRYCGQ